MKKNHVMVIDDDNYILDIYKMMIGWTPYKSFVTTEPCANRAYDTICRKHMNGDETFPDYIVIDLRMPVMSGFDFIRKFEETFPERIGKTRFIVATSSLSQDDKTEAFTFESVKDFVIKPVSGDFLEKLVVYGYQPKVLENVG